MARARGFSRGFSWARLSIGEHFAKYKWFYIILLSVCLVGLVAGFITGFRSAEDLALADVPDVTLVAFIKKDITNLSVFFSRIFAFLGLIILIWASNCKKWLLFVTFVVLLYRSFLIGINCAMLIVIYQMGGIINVILIFFPFHLLALFALLCWCVVCVYGNLVQRSSGFSPLSGEFLRNNKMCLLTAFLIAFVAYFMEALLIPYLTAAIFVGVS